MLHKFLFLTILLLFIGCLNDPADTVETAAASLAAEPASPSIVFRSSDLGSTWLPTSDGLPNDVEVSQLAVKGEQIVMSTLNHGLYISDRERQSWQQLGTDHLPNLNITALLVDGDAIYAAVFKQGIYASRDEGQTWLLAYKAQKANDIVHGIYKVGDEIWFSVRNLLYAKQDGSDSLREIFVGGQVTNLVQVGQNIVGSAYGGMVLSKDGGATWKWILEQDRPLKLSLVGDKIYALYMPYRVEVSEDMGQTWKSIQAEDASSKPFFDTAKTIKAYESAQYGVYNHWAEHWDHFFRVYTEEEGIDFVTVGGVVYLVKLKMGGGDGC